MNESSKKERKKEKDIANSAKITREKERESKSIVKKQRKQTEKI